VTTDAGAAGAPAALTIDGVSKHYGPVAALRDVAFAVPRGVVHALVGANGSGKSTLIRLIAGVEPADPGGRLAIRGSALDIHRPVPGAAYRAGVRVQHQQHAVFPELTVAENLAMGNRLRPGDLGRVPWAELDRRAERAIERYGLRASPRTRVSELTPALQMLVSVARAIDDVTETDAALVVLDEPTAALPSLECARLLEGLRGLAGGGHTVLLVTHRFDEVVATADSVTVLRDGRHQATVPCAGLDTGGLTELMTGTAVPRATAGHAVGGRAVGPPLLDVAGLAADGITGITLSLLPGEVVGVAGLLGAGKSTLLETLFGLRRLRDGSVSLAGERVDVRSPARAMAAGIALVPESRDRAVFPGQTVAQNLGAADRRSRWRGFRFDRGHERRRAADDIAGFGIVTRSLDVPVAALSGGNQQKVLLARWLRRRPRLLLLDEPTAGVDAAARRQIHDTIRDYVRTSGCALCVSSDVEELCSFADRVLVMVGGRVVGEVAGADLQPSVLAARIGTAAAA
jgi:ribose transport system ATP-binding protein